MEVYVPAERRSALREVLEGAPTLGVWESEVGPTLVQARLLVEEGDTEHMLDRLESRFTTAEDFRVLLLPLEAILPRPDVPSAAKEAQEIPAPVARISAEELYADVADAVRLNGPYVALVALSAVVAAIGVLQSEIVAIIGAMVIAPLLGPLVGLSLAITLADRKLGAQALWAGAVGGLTAFLLPMVLGVVIHVDPALPTLATRSNVELWSIALALAAGAAGTLAFTQGLPHALVGVMVAAALLPPTVVAGLLLGTGAWALLLQAGLLVATNFICILLAGIVTFAVQGIEPRRYLQADRARRARGRAIALLLLLVVLLGVAIQLAR